MENKMKTKTSTMLLSSLCILLISLAGSGCSDMLGDLELLSKKTAASSGTKTVSFDSQSATTEETPTSMTVTSPATTVGTLPSAPEKTGYIFEGWWTEASGRGTEFTETTAVTENTIIYAKWAGPYSITFTNNGGTGSITTLPSSTGSTVTLPVNTFSRTDYIFDGWATSDTGTCAYHDAASFTIGAANVTLYARWCPGKAFNSSQYSISDGVVTITGCDISTTGAMVIPSSINGYPVVKIAANAFKDCTLLTSIIIPDTVTSIEAQAFRMCWRLTSVSIPNSITTITYGTFYGCVGLTSISIPTSVTSFESAAFEYCGGLTSISIPSSQTSIEASTFMNDSGLTSIEIPISVTSIKTSAFQGCSELTSIEIPLLVTSIGNNAFNYCTKLSTITINATTPPVLGTDVFKSLPSDFVIKVPDSTVSAYKTAAGWKDLETHIIAQ